MPMPVLPSMIIGLVHVGDSLDRINRFMNGEDLNECAVGHDENEADSRMMQTATFSWCKDVKPALEDINVHVKKGSGTAVVGTMASPCRFPPFKANFAWSKVVFMSMGHVPADLDV